MPSLIRAQTLIGVAVRIVARAVLTMDGFDASVAAVGDTVESRRVIRALVRCALRHPEQAPPIPGTSARILRSRSYGPYPPLRLLYRFSDGTVYLYLVEPYDELRD